MCVSFRRGFCRAGEPTGMPLRDPYLPCTVPQECAAVRMPIAARPMEIQEGREGTRRLCADLVAEVGCRWRSGPGTAVTIPLIAGRAGGLDACTDVRDASTSTERSAKRRMTQRTTIAGLFPSSCKLSSRG